MEDNRQLLRLQLKPVNEARSPAVIHWVIGAPDTMGFDRDTKYPANSLPIFACDSNPKTEVEQSTPPGFR